MTTSAPQFRLSHTRGVPLANLAGFCFILSETRQPLSVRDLVERAMRFGIVECEPLPVGGRLPTRINHHIISLRKLELVEWEHSDGHVYYRANPLGRRIAATVPSTHDRKGEVELDNPSKAIWRSVLVNSSYVRSAWLKYFMPREEFLLKELLRNNSPITITRVPTGEREDSSTEIVKEKLRDSGYRIKSQYWDERIVYAVDRREILHGLRLWTNEAYLTDENVPSVEAAPFAHLATADNESSFEIESFIVAAWFDPEKDLPRFERLVDRLLDQRRQGNRIGIPDLIISITNEHGYAKENIREMLRSLFYKRGDKFFFERGSKFLVDNAFKLTRRDKPSVYYLNLEGSWRTSLVRFGKNTKGEKR
jgi:hypothetical protein